MEIHRTLIITAQPRGDGDPGRIETGFYKVEKGFVVMCDEDGRSTGKRLALSPNDDPKRIASKLLREQWLKRSGENDFNRPIYYKPLGLA